MLRLRQLFLHAFASLAFFSPLTAPAPATANIAGEWTQCIARIPGRQWNVVYGQVSQETCVKLGRKCAADSRYVVNYYSSPVIINAPYTRCTKRKG